MKELWFTQNAASSAPRILGAVMLVVVCVAGCGEDVCQQAIQKYIDCLANQSPPQSKTLRFDGPCNDQAVSSNTGKIPLKSRSQAYLDCRIDTLTCACPDPIGDPFD